MKRRTPESYVLQAVLDMLAIRRIFAIRLNTGTMRTPTGRMIQTHSGGAGCADVLAFPRTEYEVSAVRTLYLIVPLWIVCKSSVGKQSALQKSFQESVRFHGHHYLIARGSDDLIAWLKGNKAYR
jgi:hypothetical protein